MIIESFNPTLPVRRDNDILRHTHRMGLTTPPALHRLFLPTKSINAVSQITTRLVNAGYLARHRLAHRTFYYTLGMRSVRHFGAPRSKAMPRGEQVLPIDLGTLAFCCLGDVVRRRLLPEEIVSQYPWFPKPFLGQPFCWVVEGAAKRLAMVHVEMSEFPEQVVRKHLRQVHSLRDCQEFAKLIDEDQFMLVTVTTTAERRDSLVAAFTENPWYPSFLVLDYPDLCNLL
ncbi:MAG: hypothetical protein ABL921_04670 [Pirellula sp.]